MKKVNSGDLSREATHAGNWGQDLRSSSSLSDSPDRRSRRDRLCLAGDMEDLPRLKEKIMTYQLEGTDLGNLGYQRILLQVCGSAGHGKSSLINPFTYALHGGTFVISAPVAPAETSQGGHTMVRLPYKLTEVITLVDNRGFGKLDSFEREEVCAQLANLQPLNEVEVKWDWSYEERIRVLTSVELNTCDLLVPVFVHRQRFMKSRKRTSQSFLKLLRISQVRKSSYILYIFY
ncbi:hypothetical protein GDO81_019752 [Engystomops pustulosus]|uniref:Uncharacterized protein n=1 Tax=Engystomops pustulosus TaxID=76066 RepID=A0AAV6YSA8_ENGPU|nr:hypothetical protein GDO81_019752 [Engystomops pustulosus]